MRHRTQTNDNATEGWNRTEAKGPNVQVLTAMQIRNSRSAISNRRQIVSVVPTRMYRRHSQGSVNVSRNLFVRQRRSKQLCSIMSNCAGSEQVQWCTRTHRKRQIITSPLSGVGAVWFMKSAPSCREVSMDVFNSLRWLLFSITRS